MVVTDAAHEVRWDAGVGASGRPSLHAERSVRAGEGRAIIRDAARPLGWTEGRGTEQRIGLAAALFALALIVVIGIIAGVLVVTGQ